jgi:hypothetical protein
VALKERMHHLQSQFQLASGNQASLVKKLNKIGLRCAARFSHNDRPADEILDYDASGLPR